MKKKIIKRFGVLLLILIIHQIYWFNGLKGNLVIYVCNVSEKDSVKINLYIDNKKIDSNIYTNTTFYSFKSRSLNVFPGKHKIVLETNNSKVLEEYEFFTFLIKRVVVEYQGKNNQLENNKEFLIHSESVFGNLIIE